MSISEWSESIFIAEVNDEPAFSEEMDALMQRLDEVPGPLPDVIVNAACVTYLNSSNIAQLLKLRKRLIDAGTRLRLCGIQERVWTVMLATGLESVFEFTDDVSTSLASLLIQSD
ncbi:MAG: STAS domain-containing protein [Phycisphaerales bacterium]|nr:STAS domain-containing protein [Phycisphaerae bacterium]NNF41732.1 STAS domain-containing protein [Phycisphaerales bacterium]NNM25672.1 STAS domain-containing protein [Phycisphaerales bacterium]